MTPQTVCLRADPARVRVAVRRRNGAFLWRASVAPIVGLSVVRFSNNPARAVEDALVAALRLGLPGITLDGADYPHPQRREP